MATGKGQLNPGGAFGRWIEDEYGLPAYEYTCDQDNDPAAAAFTTEGPSRLHWHQLGNHRINAIATNRGEVQVIESSRGLQWLNFHDPARLCPGGGIALIQINGGEIESDLYSPGAPARGYRRIFGAGYYRKFSIINNIELDHRIIIPFGDDPAVVAEIIAKNTGEEKLSADIFEFFGINLHYLSMAPVYTTGGRTHFTPWNFGNAAAGVLNTLLGSVADADKRRTAFAARFDFSGEITHSGAAVATPRYIGGRPPPRAARDSRNYYPYPLFMARLPGGGSETILNAETLFTKTGGFRARPDAGKNNIHKLKHPCLCMGTAVDIQPGETARLAFVFGSCAREDIEGLVEKYRAAAGGEKDFMELNAAEWQEKLPVFSIPDPADAEWAARETRWHTYYSRSAFMYDEYYGTRYAPQGGAYEYLHGFRGAVRDLALYVTGLVYIAPELARDLLLYCFRMMTPEGRIMYAAHGFGKATGAFVHEHPSDLQLFLFRALAEYVFFTRDYGLLDEESEFYSSRRESATVYEKIKIALEYLYGKIGLGEHGLVRVGDGDWSDGISLFVGNRGRFVRRGESVFNSALAMYALPRLADLLEARDPVAAEKARSFAAGLLDPVLKCFNGKWFYRAYDGAGRPVGDKHIFLEHHTWLLISRALPDDMAKSVVNNVYKILDRPSPFGQYVLYPPQKTLFDQYAPGWDVNGGIWFAMNYLLCWGYGCYDAEKAWSAFRKNSMAAKATVYPKIWYGIWSGPDSINADHGPRPGETFFHLPTPGTDFPVMNLNLHAGYIAALVNLCGIEPTARGEKIKPLLPFDNFSLSTPTFDLKDENGIIVYERKI